MKTTVSCYKVNTAVQDNQKHVFGKMVPADIVLTDEVDVWLQGAGEMLLTTGEAEYIVNVSDLMAAVAGFQEARNLQRMRLNQLNRGK